jgi:P-type Cu+ transporter
MLSAAVTGTPPRPGTQVQLAITGMTCAACAAQVEKKLNALDGVTATVNFGAARASLTVHRPAAVPAKRLIAAVEQAGYGAAVIATPGKPLDREGSGDQRRSDAALVRYLRRRLIVALVFLVPLSDVSVLLSLFPAYRFAGWQWVLVALAAPVAGWAAWPFHRAALRNARHGAMSMDTLVSLGIAAACGWSVFAMFVLDRHQARVSGMHLLLHASGGGIYLEVAASVTTFLLAGRWYEARARRDAGDAMRELASAAAAEASVLDGDGRAARPGRAAGSWRPDRRPARRGRCG